MYNNTPMNFKTITNLDNPDDYAAAEARAQRLFDSDDPTETAELDKLVELMLDYDERNSESYGDDEWLPETMREEWQDLLQRK